MTARAVSLVAGALMGALVLLGVVELGAALVYFGQWDLLRRALEGLRISAQALGANDQRVGFFAVLVEAVRVVCFILFLVIVYQAYRRLETHQSLPRRYPAYWSLWGFFVPLLNFFRPFQIMGELLRLRGQANLGRARKVLLWSWWILFWADFLFSRCRFLFYPGKGTDLAALTQYAWLVFVTQWIGLFSILVTVLLLGFISLTAQENRSLAEAEVLRYPDGHE